MAELEKLYCTDSKVEAVKKINAIIENGGGGGTLQMFDTVLKDHILTFEESQGLALQGTYVYKEAISGSRYGYPDFYAKCLDEKETATATETTLGANTITMYVNANGHKFYDIADKSIIDEWYETYGIADFYGVDTENERIFLPRNKHFMQLTDDTSKVNNMVEAGLPNITGSTILAAEHENNSYSGAFVPSTVHNVNAFDRDASGGWGEQRTVIFDASRSNSTYGKSDTVQPQASLKLLYYCVGNTVNYAGVTDVVSQGMEILEQVNLGIESRVKLDASNLNTDGKSLIAGMAMPSNKYIDLTLGATGSQYTAPANGWYVLDKTPTAAGQYMSLGNTSNEMRSAMRSVSNVAGYSIYVPAKRNDVVQIDYNFAGTVRLFRFVYAQGSESEE